VTRWVAGRILEPLDAARPDVLPRAAAALGRVHAGPPAAGHVSAFRSAEAYREVASQHGVALPPDLERWLALGRRIEGMLPPATPVLCHNDLLPGNLIDDGVRIRMRFDLGNPAAHAELEAEAERRLLAAYFAEGAPPDALRRLRLMRVASDLREAIWALVQVGISGLTFDFGAYAARYLARVAAGTAALAI